MSIQRLQPGKRLSAAVVHADTIYLAGQIAGDPSADIKGQTQQILRKIDDLLAAAGTSKSKLLSATIWLADMRYYDDMNSAWDTWMDPANPPARATVEARLAAPSTSSRSRGSRPSSRCLASWIRSSSSTPAA